MKRGEIWTVNFDPTEGDEIQKLRPAVIVSMAGPFRQKLRIVVPITTWQSKFQFDYWMISLPMDAITGLENPSAVNTFQVRSVSEQRLKKRIGRVSTQQLDEIVAAIALCIGFVPKT